MNKENDLKKISLLYSSDKVEHGYIDIYHDYFKEIKDEKLKILEIGIADGYSLLTWSDYFKNSTIIGIDIHKIDDNCSRVFLSIIYPFSKFEQREFS